MILWQLQMLNMLVDVRFVNFGMTRLTHILNQEIQWVDFGNTMLKQSVYVKFGV